MESAGRLSGLWRGQCTVIRPSYIVLEYLRFFFFQAEDGIRDVERSRGLGDVYKRQYQRRVHGDCWPYVSQRGTPYVCPNFCYKNFHQPFKTTKCEKDSLIVLNNTDAIKEEILKNGPVISYMNVYSDLQNYKGGIYTRSSSHFLEGSMMSIIGWGVENGISFWICTSSFGEDWGENGYMRIKIGELDLGKKAYACTPPKIQIHNIS
eukprot:TRINITY_DN22884_c0_g1_i1.p1 TRINITY_DN22884_c0_g1~~TRINITY_DN22884_c0_g1_i1.p1  ORF type:complete len:207 (-),score=26.81 TRINITY_DN22884_c0_g1_i1:44-664(-)